MHEASQVVSQKQAFPWKRLAAAEGVLVGALGLCAVVGGYLGWQRAGTPAWAAAAAALAVCWFPNAVSLVLMGLLSDPRSSVFAMLVSMLTRVAWPFLLVYSLLQRGHWLIDAGVLPMVVVLYLIGLVAETVMSVWMIGANRAPAVKAS